MSKTKPKGTILIDLDEFVTSFDGEFNWRSKEGLAGIVLLERDDDGRPIEGQVISQEKLTRRRAITIALCNDPKNETFDPEAKLRAGHLLRMFWKDQEIKLDSSDVEFIKNRLNFQWSAAVYFYMCEYLEGVTT